MSFPNVWREAGTGDMIVTSNSLLGIGDGHEWRMFSRSHFDGLVFYLML